MTERLDIINAALLASGVSPVTTYSSQHPDVQNVDPVINKVSKQVQKKGWWFNTDYGLTLSPDTTGKILIPSDTLKIDPTDTGLSYVRRGKYLYDPVGHTFVISRTVDVTVVSELSIEDLPESAALYILERVVHEFYMNDDGDPQKARSIGDRASLALIELKNDEFANSDVNSNNRPQVVLMRSGIKTSGTSSSSYNPNYLGGTL